MRIALIGGIAGWLVGALIFSWVIKPIWFEPEEPRQFTIPQMDFTTGDPNTGYFRAEGGPWEFSWVGTTIWRLTELSDDSYLFETMPDPETNGWPDLLLECGPVVDRTGVIEMHTEGANSPNIVGTGPVTLELGN